MEIRHDLIDNFCRNGAHGRQIRLERTWDAADDDQLMIACVRKVKEALKSRHASPQEPHDNHQTWPFGHWLCRSGLFFQNIRHIFITGEATKICRFNRREVMRKHQLCRRQGEDVSVLMRQDQESLPLAIMLIGGRHGCW